MCKLCIFTTRLPRKLKRKRKLEGLDLVPEIDDASVHEDGLHEDLGKVANVFQYHTDTGPTTNNKAAIKISANCMNTYKFPHTQMKKTLNIAVISMMYE